MSAAEVGKPGRHLPAFNGNAYRLCPGPCLAISHQGKRRDLTRTVARLAVSLKNGENIAVEAGPRARQGEALERCVMSAAEDPGLIRRASSVGTKRHEITPRFNQALTAAHLLGENVAEHAALFLLEVVESGTQLVKHAPRNEGGGGQLGIGVLKLLAGTQAEILVDADVA